MSVQGTSQEMAGIASPEISVIVTAYNAAGSIVRCIDSILAQSFRDFELLVLNDGSTDATEKVIGRYNDPRIRYFRHENHGVAFTRQRGLELADGRFSIFVDSDDWIEADMLEGMLRTREESDADMVICDIVEEFGDRRLLKRQDPGTSDPSVIQWKMLNELHAGMVNKLIRHSLYKQYEISFLGGVNCCEDQLLLIRLLDRPLKVAYVEKAYYHYDKSINEDSITNRWHDRPVKEWLMLLEAIEPYMKSDEARKAFDNYAARRLYDATYAGPGEQADYRLLYTRCRSRLRRSSLPRKHKIISHLRYAGLGWLIRLLRQIHA